MRPAKVSATTGPADIRSITGCSPAGNGGKSPRFLPIPHDISDLPNRRRPPAPGFRFIEDPVAGAKYSRSTSIVSSAYKRHGKILETAIREGLRDSNRHRVWSEDVFRVSTAANALVNSLVGLEGEEACRRSALPYGERARSLQVDMMAFDEVDRTMRAYEVKRGNGQFDAGKIRS